MSTWHIEAYDKLVAALLPGEIAHVRNQLGTFIQDEDLIRACRRTDQLVAIMLDIRDNRWNPKKP